MTSSETSFVQGGRDQTCHCCGEEGHISPQCLDKKTIEKKDWFVRKTQLNTQAAQQEDEQEDKESTIDISLTSNCSKDRGVARSGLLISRSIEKESHCNDNREMGNRLKNWIAPDNGSMLSLFSNPDLLVEDV